MDFSKFLKAKLMFIGLEESGLIVPNSWVRRQNDIQDRATNGIYDCDTKSDLDQLAERDGWSSELRIYGAHRWRNFKRHDAWLMLLDAIIDEVTIPNHLKQKTEDFVLNKSGIFHSFDLKVTRFPKKLVKSTSDIDLAEWYYLNQSQESRKHWANRFFVVGDPEESLYDFEKSVETIKKFAQDMSSYRHFLTSPSGKVVRTVVLRQF